MPNSPFSSDYAGTTPTQAAIATTITAAAADAAAPTRAAETRAEVKKPISLAVQAGFNIGPMSLVSGKPRRVVIRGKVTRD